MIDLRELRLCRMRRIVAYNLTAVFHLVLAILLAMVPRQDPTDSGIELAAEWTSEYTFQGGATTASIADAVDGLAGRGEIFAMSPREVVKAAARAMKDEQMEAAIHLFTAKAQERIRADGSILEGSGVAESSVDQHCIKGDVAYVAVKDSDRFSVVLQRTAKGWRIRGFRFILVEWGEYSIENGKFVPCDGPFPLDFE